MFGKIRSTNLLIGITALVVFAIANVATITLAAAADVGITPELLAAAKKEGQATYYTSLELVNAIRLKAAFENKYGIKVNILRLSSSVVFNRAVQEFDVGINAADTLETSVVDHFVDLKAKNMLMPFTPASLNLFRSPKLYDSDHYWHGSKILLDSINYNKDLLKGDMVPKTWKDLTDPKYSGKVVQGHVKSSGTTLQLVYNLVRMYGWEYFEALRKNNILTLQTMPQAFELVARGERLIVMGEYTQLYTARAQNLLMFAGVLPQDGVIYVLCPVAVLAKAPHPNAAKVFVNWLLSPEGQTIYAEGGNATVLDSPEVKLPADFPNLKNYKLIDSDLNDFKKWLPGGIEKFAELFGG